MHLLFRRLLLVAAFCPLPVFAQAPAADCTSGASDACFFSLALKGGALHYYGSLPSSTGSPDQALIALHGHSHDANKTFNSALLALRRGGALGRTLVISPLFQVGASDASRCSTRGVPEVTEGDLSWTCSSWINGSPAQEQGAVTSFEAMDALIAEVHRRWPSVKTITLAGFSAGAQMVQHEIGFAAPAPEGVALRYVVADPGSWLYFDPDRSAPPALACPDVNRWKYGVEGLPAYLGRQAGEARARYAAADIHYLEGALDDGPGPGTAARVLDRSCAAEAQGSYRLQRGQAYVAYDRERIAPAAQRELTVVPGCAHDVACVFPSEAARAALLGKP